MDQSKHSEGVTSVKYSGQKPGGNSSFSLAHDTGEPDDRFGGRGNTIKQPQT